MSDPRSRITLDVHETPEAIYASFARVFTEQEHDNTRWVGFSVGDVEVHLFATKGAKVVPA